MDPEFENSIFFNETDYMIFFRPLSPESELINITKASELAFRLSDPNNLFIFLFEGIGVILLSCLGIVGNILSAMVLIKMKTSVGCFLLFLTMCDLLVLVTASTVFGIPTIASYLAPLPAAKAFAQLGFLLPGFFVVGMIGI